MKELFADISNLPLVAIERIDILLPDNSSTFYGSDAVGGVTNFVMQNDFCRPARPKPTSVIRPVEATTRTERDVAARQAAQRYGPRSARDGFLFS